MIFCGAKLLLFSDICKKNRTYGGLCAIFSQNAGLYSAVDMDNSYLKYAYFLGT